MHTLSILRFVALTILAVAQLSTVVGAESDVSEIVTNQDRREIHKKEYV